MYDRIPSHLGPGWGSPACVTFIPGQIMRRMMMKMMMMMMMISMMIIILFFYEKTVGSQSHM
jgi:hypothetical protein